MSPQRALVPPFLIFLKWGDHRGAVFVSRDLLKKIPEFGEFESAFYPFRVLPAE